MNLSKTKTILIVALIFTNLFFGGVILKEKLVGIELREKLINSLEKKEIYFENNDFKFSNTLKKAYVKYNNYDFNVEAKKILGPNYIKNSDLYLNKDYYLEFKKKNILIYSKRGVSIGKNTTSFEEAKKIGEIFLVENDYLNDTVFLKKFENKETGILLIYSKVVDGKFIEESYMKLRVFNEKIVYFERKWLEVELTSFNRNDIISFERALYKLSKNLNNSSTVIIKDVKIGYILEQDIFIQNIQSGEAFPYYKFVFTNGEEYYIEAIEN